MISQQTDAPPQPRSERCNRRSAPRSVLVRHVWVQGRGQRFVRFEQEAFTLEISDGGFRLGGIYRHCLPASMMTVSAHGRTARYRVVWVASRDSPYEGQCGMQRIDGDPLFPDIERAAASPAMAGNGEAGQALIRIIEWFAENSALSREGFDALFHNRDHPGQHSGE